MAPPIRRTAALLLVAFPLLGGCAHMHQGSAMNGKAPALLSEDGPRGAHGGTNPNAPYTLAATKPQLVKRDSAMETDALAACNEDNLQISEISAAMNDTYRAVKLAFRNTGATSCRMGGYPSIQLEDAKGAPVASLVVDKVTISTLGASLAQGSLPVAAPENLDAQVTLAANGQAWFQVGWTTGAGCPLVSRIRVSAPDSQKSFTLDRPLTVCEGRVELTALHTD